MTDFVAARSTTTRACMDRACMEIASTTTRMACMEIASTTIRMACTAIASMAMASTASQVACTALSPGPCTMTACVGMDMEDVDPNLAQCRTWARLVSEQVFELGA